MACKGSALLFFNFLLSFVESRLSGRSVKNKFAYYPRISPLPEISTWTGSGAHLASCTMRTGGPFPGGKSPPGHDADHSLASSAEVKNKQELYLLSHQTPPRRVVGLFQIIVTSHGVCVCVRLNQVVWCVLSDVHLTEAICLHHQSDRSRLL
jgi:hypothetical protein